MPIDREQPPTNKVLLECGPEGTCRLDGISFCVRVPIDNSSIIDNSKWSLLLYERHENFGGSDMWIEMTPNSLTIPRRTAMHIGTATTLGEVISLYETLSQKKWPGCD